MVATKLSEKQLGKLRLLEDALKNAVAQGEPEAAIEAAIEAATRTSETKKRVAGKSKTKFHLAQKRLFELPSPQDLVPQTLA